MALRVALRVAPVPNCCPSEALQSISVAGLTVTCPAWLPSRGWSLHTKGYVIYTSRKKQSLIKRGDYMHRVVMRALAGGNLPTEVQVHHQTHNKGDNAPRHLCAMPQALNPAPNSRFRCPWTGQFLSAAEYQRRMGA